MPGLRELAAAPDPLAQLNRRAAARGLRTGAGRPLVFAAADDAPHGVAYESHIAATGRVPTRLNQHDLLNALAWLAFPRAKARLNALQAAEIERCGVAADRGALRDAATVFDENGVLLVTEDDDLQDRLRAHDWRGAFVERRAAWDGVRVLCFGHALLEKLAAPYKGITGHAFIVSLPASSPREQIDAEAAAGIDARFTTAALTPLPVLGVPGWWRGNEEIAFYDDDKVFRPARGVRTAVQCASRGSTEKYP